MIELENLNNQPLGEILEEAKKQISYISTEWTNLQESDPGLTLLELFVWLKSVQHEYLNRISDGVKNKFLDLLDVRRYKDRGSEALLEISDLIENIHIPRGSRWMTGNMSFENSERQWLVNSRILSISFKNPDFSLDSEYYKFDDSRAFDLFGTEFREVDKNKPRIFTINLDRPIPSKVPVNLYFDIDIEEGLSRNPIDEKDDFVDVAKLKWSYYGTKDGKIGWHDMEVIKDNTYKFLFSGVIRLKFDGNMESNNGVYSIRCDLLENVYDFPPKIRQVKLNVFKAFQRLTMCENVIIKKKDLINQRHIEVYTHLALYGEHIVYFKKYGGWIKVNKFTVRRDVKAGKAIIDVQDINQLFNDYLSDDDMFMVVSYDKRIEKKMILGSGTGTSLQHIEIRDQDISFDGFGIMVGIEKENQTVFSPWERVDDFFSSGKYDKHYVLDHEKEFLLFGDHENGMAPRKGKDNIRLNSLVFCRGENSNVKEGMINRVITDNPILLKARITQITSATGGRNREPIEHAQARASDLFSDSGRAVTMEDYQKIVSRTPGLMFKNVRILPNYMPGEDCMKQSCITVAVRWNNKVGLKLPKSYEQNIMNQIDRHRLVNTKVRVVGPEYIGVIINGSIVVNSFYRIKDRFIEKSIERFIDNLNDQLGQTLHFGDMFGMIDRLEYVSYLENLKIMPVGNYIQKTVAEDIVIPPNGVYYIERIDLSYVRNSEIYRN